MISGWVRVVSGGFGWFHVLSITNDGTPRRRAWKICKRCQGSGSCAKCLAVKKSLQRTTRTDKDRLETGGEAVANKD